MKSKRLGAIIASISIPVILIGGFLSAHTIKAGYVGIVYNMNGGIEDKVLTQGLRFTLPWQKVTKYSVGTEQILLSADKREGSEDDESFSIPTSDGKTANVDVEMSMHFDQDKLPETFTRFKGQSGEDIENTFVKNKLKAWCQEVSSNYSVIDIYGDKRSKLNAEALEHVKEKFKEYGIVVDTLNFTRIGLDDATEQAIQARINKQQEVETAKLEKEKAEIGAEQKRIEAQGEADANNIKSNSIDDKILKQKFIEKWDGKTPVVTGDGNNMFDLSSFMKDDK